MTARFGDERLTDLGEVEARGLGVADELDSIGRIAVVVAVARRGSGGFGDETFAFPEPDRLGRDRGSLGQLTGLRREHPLTFQSTGKLKVAAVTQPHDTREPRPMRIELLYFDDCPHWKIADERLHAVASARGLEVVHQLVTTPEEAEATRFRGSPTILVDGRDPFAAGDEPVGLSCRVYQTPDGPAGAPTFSQLEEVLDA